MSPSVSPSPAPRRAAQRRQQERADTAPSSDDGPFTLRLELPRTQDPAHPCRRSVQFYRGTSVGTLSRSIRAAFFEEGGPTSVGAGQGGGCGGRAFVHSGSGAGAGGGGCDVVSIWELPADDVRPAFTR